MKQITFTLIFVIVCALSLFAQAPDKITRKCPSPNTSAFGSVSVVNEIVYTPCPDQSSFFNGQVKLLDKTYTPTFAPSTNYFTIGTGTRYLVADANNFVASELRFPLTLSGTNKIYLGQRVSLDVQGTFTNPTITGTWTDVFSNSTFPAGTGTIYGSITTLDVGGQFNEANGAYISAQSGSSGASGLGTIRGLYAVVGMAHNGNTTNAFAGDFWLSSSASTPSAVVTAAAIRARTSLRPGVSVTDLNLISLSGSTLDGGSATNTSGIYADTSIDIGTSSSYFINSLSQSPSRLSANLAILRTLGNANGLILQAPNSSCWKITVDNAGALSTASTACP